MSLTVEFISSRRAWEIPRRTAAERPVSPRQVHAVVEALLDAPVLWGSVKQALSGNITGTSTELACFEWVRWAPVGVARLHEMGGAEPAEHPREGLLSISHGRGT